ncbi:hypothetical protein [Arthrobacter sp. 9V]|uniref:hypothetical protein n=1 Tax=Arthrobacter sp. 9V TaxID=2653132 RepID=UPI00135B3C09|nr:hypothetical protein [Arthrobacter sp. 9V]
MTGNTHALEHQSVAATLAIHTEREILTEPSSGMKGKGRRIALIAGIVMGHAVTLFGPQLLGRWPLAPL